MEGIVEHNTMLFIGFAVTFLLEVLRFFCFSALKLNLSWEGGLRYPYYLPWATATIGIGSGLNVVLVAALDWVWLSCWDLPSPWSLYTCGLFLVVLAAVVAGLFYVVKLKIEDWKDSISGKPKGEKREKSTADDEESGRLLKMLAFVTALALLCFIVQPLRGITGSILIVLATSAAGQMVRFSGWDDLVQWVTRPAEDEEQPAARKNERVKVRLFCVAEGYLARRGERLELVGEQLAAPDDDPVAALSQRVLDRSRLTEVIRALDRVDQRDDLLAEIPALIARNLGKLAARQEALSQAGGPVGENEARMQATVRNLLDQELGDQMLSLLYWHYDLPGNRKQNKGRDAGKEKDKDKGWLRFSVHRLPQVGMKPLITFHEYLGLFPSWWARRRVRARS
jgi:hypothetical protein